MQLIVYKFSRPLCVVGHPVVGDSVSPQTELLVHSTGEVNGLAERRKKVRGQPLRYPPIPSVDEGAISVALPRPKP